MPGDFHAIFLIGWRSVSIRGFRAYWATELGTPKKLAARCRVADNTLSNLTGPGNEAQTFRTDVSSPELTGRFYKFYSSRKCWKYGFKPQLQYDQKKKSIRLKGIV